MYMVLWRNILRSVNRARSSCHGRGVHSTNQRLVNYGFQLCRTCIDVWVTYFLRPVGYGVFVYLRVESVPLLY